jgi:uncharacterized protein (TIGR02186 family)
MGAPFLPMLMMVAALLPAAVGGSGPDQAGPGITLQVNKPEILITSGFHGDVLRVSGRAPADADVIVRLSSETSGETLDLKGKRGVLWLSVGKVRFDNVPRLYMIRSDRPLEEILSPAQQARGALGLHGLKSSLRVQRGVDTDLFVSEFLRMKRDEGLYDWAGGGVTRERGGGYRTEFPWPAKGPSGIYLIEAFAATRGELVSSAMGTIVVKKVGAEEWVSRLAADHGLIYGLLSAALALATGLAMNVLFGMFGPLRKKKPPAAVA